MLQVPGLNDPAQLKELIGKTAKLTFHLVDQTMSASEAQTGNPPPGSAVYQSQDPNEPPPPVGEALYVTGEDLVDSSATFDQRTKSPRVLPL